MKKNIYSFTASINCYKNRLDKTIYSELANILQSRNIITKYIEQGNVKVNNIVIYKKHFSINAGDIVEINTQNNLHISSKIIDIPVIYEDIDIIIINKPVEISVHPDVGINPEETVTHFLQKKYPQITVGEALRPGIIHRLDRNTHGLMIIAKNQHSYDYLKYEMLHRRIHRNYKAIIWGAINPRYGLIELPIGRDKVNYKKFSARSYNAVYAATKYKTLATFHNKMFSLIECSLITGRRHQIRVHLSHKGHSILGDKLYGNNKRKINKIQDQNLHNKIKNIEHQALHAYQISFTHPTTKKTCQYEIDINDKQYDALFANIDKISTDNNLVHTGLYT